MTAIETETAMSNVMIAGTIGGGAIGIATTDGTAVAGAIATGITVIEIGMTGVITATAGIATIATAITTATSGSPMKSAGATD